MAFYSGYQCDKCGTRIETQGNSASEVSSITHLRRLARKHDGWSIGKQLLCKSCKKESKTELKEQ